MDKLITADYVNSLIARVAELESESTGNGIRGTVEAWEEGRLGLDEKYVQVSDLKIGDLEMSDLITSVIRLRHDREPTYSDREVSIVKGIKDLQAKLNEVPSTIQEFVDRIEKLEAEKEDNKDAHWSDVNDLQATITKLEAELEFMKNNWVNPTGEL